MKKIACRSQNKIRQSYKQSAKAVEINHSVSVILEHEQQVPNYSSSKEKTEDKNSILKIC